MNINFDEKVLTANRKSTCSWANQKRYLFNWLLIFDMLNITNCYM